MPSYQPNSNFHGQFIDNYLSLLQEKDTSYGLFLGIDLREWSLKSTHSNFASSGSVSTPPTVAPISTPTLDGIAPLVKPTFSKSPPSVSFPLSESPNASPRFLLDVVSTDSPLISDPNHILEHSANSSAMKVVLHTDAAGILSFFLTILLGL